MRTALLLGLLLVAGPAKAQYIVSSCTDTECVICAVPCTGTRVCGADTRTCNRYDGCGPLLAGAGCYGQPGYNCDSSSCGADSSCQVAIDPSTGQQLPGNDCQSNSCVTSAVPGSNPPTFVRYCGGAGGPAESTSAPPGSGSGSGGSGSGGSGDGQKGAGGSQTCRVGGPGHAGDPVSISDGRSVLNLQDVTIPSTVWPITFTRTYHSVDREWLQAGSLGSSTTQHVAVPFGTDRDTNAGRTWSINWWHNWYAFAWPESSTRWQVRLPGGQLVTFTPCTVASGQTTCIASTTSDSTEARAQLLWNSAAGGSFTYFAPSGQRMVFSAQLPRAGVATRYFLSSIQDRAGQRTVATVTYQVPPTADCNVAPGINPANGVPFISAVTSAEGMNLYFSYVNRAPTIPAPRANGEQQCVLRSLRVGRSTPGTLAATFKYADVDARGGQIRSTEHSLLPEVGAPTLPSVQTTITPGPAVPYLRLHLGYDTTDAGLAATHHEMTPYDRVLKAYKSAGGNRMPYPELNYPASPGFVSSCPPNTSCVTSSAATISLIHEDRTQGTGANLRPNPTSTATQVLLTAGAPSRRTTSTTINATHGLDTQSPSAGESYQISTTANGPFNSKIAGPRSDTVVAATAVTASPHIAVNSVTIGRAPDATETTSYQYVYIGSPVTQQLVSREERNSVVPTQPSGKARTHYQYHTDGRLKGVIREGWTRIANGAPSATTWTDENRFVGTFYLSTDALGRTTEVQGPCRVSNATSTSCLSSPFPVTRFTYHPATGNEANRINTVTRFPAGTSGIALTTTYSTYDALGNAQTVTDENSVPTTYTFEANRPKTMTIGGKTWTYTYDRGHLTKVQRPEGDSDVICYRRLPSNSFALNYGCPSSENPSDEPTAIFRYGSGAATWSEATILNYGVDGELREELSYHQTNTTYTESTLPFRRTTRERNPLGFTTFEKTGPGPNGTAERTTRQFGGDGLVAAQSTPYFSAPDFCGTPPAARSDLCTKFDYWNTGRLKEMAVKPLDGANPDIRVCLDYDAHGNVTGVKPNCTTTGMHSYVWDDFGNVISAKLSTSDQPIRYETDARGNVIRKGMTVDSNTVTLEWDYDQLNRPTQARENGTVVSAWVYDNDPSQATNLPAGCTPPPTPSRTAGRLVWARDAVWRTWYSYDLFGRVTREARVNAAGLSCSSTSELGRQQAIERTFTDNGNELTIKYPSGRTVTNSYDSTKRLSGMAMTTWNFGWSAAPGTTMASNVSWFPGGNLKSYDLVTRPTLGGAPSTVTVSYRYGSAGNLPTDEIPSTTCTTSEVDPNGMGDSSGRLRAMYVTRGTTNMLRIFYRWRGEQLIEQSRCYLTSTTPEWEYFVDRTGADAAFQYDRAGRLGGGRLPNFGTTGGYCERRAYSYDTRGNRTQEKVYYGLGSDSYFSDSSRPDQLSATVYNNGSTSNPLLGWARDGNGTANVPVYSGRNRSYLYDSIGRTGIVSGTNGSSNWLMSLYGSGGTVTGSESVLRYATLWDVQGGNQTFNYFYDPQNRRVRKQYPNGDLEGYFWDADKRLLMETAPENVGSTRQVMDEYLWLGQRPLLMLRSSYNVSGNSWQRDRADWDSGWCVRRGAALECRPYGIVSDVLAKPVMTVDSVNRISGVLEYEPYGAINRYSYWTDLSPAPDGCWWVAYGLNQGSSPLSRQMRMHLPRVEAGAAACLYQYVGGVQTDTACGQRWNYWTPWRPVPNGSSLDVVYCSNSTNLTPQPRGVTTDVYEYQEYESGATPYIPPFRLPGQYYDPETDLHENWNRYYDPSTGRYLSPEPKLGPLPPTGLQPTSASADVLALATTPGASVATSVPESGPVWVAGLLRDGRSVPAFAYAENNPVVKTDPDGLGTHFTNPAICKASPYDCPFMVRCGEQRCDLTACGDARVDSLPPAAQNLVVKAWCAYTCSTHPGGDECGPVVTGAATVVKTFWGGKIQFCH